MKQSKLRVAKRDRPKLGWFECLVCGLHEDMTLTEAEAHTAYHRDHEAKPVTIS